MLLNVAVGLCLLSIEAECFLLKNNFQDEADIIEMDIKVDDRLREVIENAKTPNSSRRKRDAIKYNQRRWKNAIVPYSVDDNLGSSARSALLYAIDEFHKVTCLWFTPRKNEKDYLRIVSGEGCYSKIGRQGGEQVLSIGPGCTQKSIVMHELMHAIGFFHENSRYDRDQYVKVLWWNIRRGAEKNFLMYHHGRIDTLSMPYDLHSLMHYDNKAFTKNRGDTLQAKENPMASLGGNSLSNTDLKQIWILYGCRRRKFKRRNESCKDKFGSSCIIFLGYPKQCLKFKSFTMKDCRRTCRICEPAQDQPTRGST